MGIAHLWNFLKVLWVWIFDMIIIWNCRVINSVKILMWSRLYARDCCELQIHYHVLLVLKTFPVASLIASPPAPRLLPLASPAFAPGSSAGKESSCNAGDPSSILGLGRSTGERIGYMFQYSWASLVAQMVKNPPAMWEIWVWSLGWEDLLEEDMATNSSFLAWRIPMDRAACQATVHEVAESDTTEWLTHTYFSPVFHIGFFSLCSFSLGVHICACDFTYCALLYWKPSGSTFIIPVFSLFFLSQAVQCSG